MIEIIHPGLLTTVQDRGRPGFRHLGVAPGGAADADALRIANKLLGNDECAAVLEFTLTGACVRFRREATLAICGSIEADCEGERLPTWRPLRVHRGAVVKLGRVVAGARAYLAIGGGIDVPTVLGSRSTDLRGHFGGFQGRALRAGDRLALGRPAALTGRMLAQRLQRSERRWVAASWWVTPPDDLEGDFVFLHLLDATHSRGLDRGSIRRATHGEWLVSAASDRMGVRFDGVELGFERPPELVSAGTAPGTVQLPPDGHPIVLGVDAQTTGGYPRIAHVIAADLPRLMQLRPGNRVQVVRVTREAAAAAWLARQRSLARMSEAISGRLASE